jgi:hypothetical protein
LLFCFISSCSVKNQCLSGSRAQNCLWFFFEKFLLGHEPMLVWIKGSRLFVGFFLRSSCSVKNQCLSRSRA